MALLTIFFIFASFPPRRLAQTPAPWCLRPPCLVSPSGVALVKLGIALPGRCHPPADGPVGLSSTGEKSLREIADSQVQEFAPADERAAWRRFAANFFPVTCGFALRGMDTT